MKKNNLLYLGSSVLLVASFALGFLLYRSFEQDQFEMFGKNNPELFVRDYSPVLGGPGAKIYITEFLDPECESCRAFYPAVKDLLNEYKGKVKLVVRYAAFHKNSEHAIKVLEATRQQGKYWQALELLFQTQPYWASHHHPKPEFVFKILPQLGLDIERLKKDMLDPKIQKIIDQDAKDLKTLNVRGTPTFFVNGKPLEKFGLQYLKSAIESELKE